MALDMREIGTLVAQHSRFVQDVMQAMERVIVGQKSMLERLLVGLLANGHVLLEGVPGLAKTRAVTTLAQALQADYQRIQFTPDLLPAGPHWYAHLPAPNRRLSGPQGTGVRAHCPGG